jgi:polar amino acid transport system permease protein
MSCLQTVQDYAFRSLGYGERLLPRGEITLCEQVVLIGSGMIWNVYFGALALGAGFFFATALAVAKNSRSRWLRKPAEWFIFVFRGSPLFIQFFVAYNAFVLMPAQGIEFRFLGVEFTAETRWLTRAWAGALIVLFLNTAAYSAEIFYGALRAIPRGDFEAADAYGLTGFRRFRRIVFPTMLRLAWPAYTNEAIFLFHATALVFSQAFPHGSSRATRSITRNTSRTGRSTPSCPTRSSRPTSSASRSSSSGASGGSTSASTGTFPRKRGAASGFAPSSSGDPCAPGSESIPRSARSARPSPT